MKGIFFTLTLIFGHFLCAQNCCQATETFAALGASSQFQMSHQLPKSGQQSAVGEYVLFSTPDEKKGRAYVISAEGSHQFLFLFHEWWGLNGNIEAEAEKWHKKFPEVNVVALDLYDGMVATTREAASKLMKSADETRIRNIIQGAAEWAGQDAKIATLGWCFGGGWSMQTALQLGPQVKGCVIFYGMPETDPALLTNLEGKVLGIFAEKDQWINRKVVAKYEKAMNQANRPYETLWFDAEHAFANPSNPIFNKDAAREANAKTAAFLQAVFD